MHLSMVLPCLPTSSRNVIYSLTHMHTELEGVWLWIIGGYKRKWSLSGNMLFTSSWTIVLLELTIPSQTGALSSHWMKEQYRKQLWQSSCQVTTETEVGTFFSVMARKILSLSLNVLFPTLWRTTWFLWIFCINLCQTTIFNIWGS